jgi:hypothetical protein
MNTIEPHAPASLPAYLADGLPKQDRETLDDIHEYVEALIEHKEQLDDQPITDEDLPDNAETVDDNGPKGAVMREFRTCGDESCHCMNGGEKHGPYNYRIWREDNNVKKAYVGKAT